MLTWKMHGTTYHLTDGWRATTSQDVRYDTICGEQYLSDEHLLEMPNGDVYCRKCLGLQGLN